MNIENPVRFVVTYWSRRDNPNPMRVEYTSLAAARKAMITTMQRHCAERALLERVETIQTYTWDEWIAYLGERFDETDAPHGDNVRP